MRDMVSPRGAIRTMASLLRHRLVLGVLCLAAAGFTAGCMDMEQSIVINKDLTGTAGFKMTMDLEGLATQVLQMQRAAQGQAGAPTADELTQFKSMMAMQLGNGIFDVDALKKALPAGVTLLDATQKPDGFKVLVNFTFAYTDITKLPEIALSPNAAMGQSAGSAPMKLFEDLDFKNDGAMLVISTKTGAPAGGAGTPTADADMMGQLLQQLQQPGVGAMLGAMQGGLTGLRIALRIDTPLTVVENNATRKDGAAMLWEQSLDAVAKTPIANLKPSDIKPMNVLVRIKK